MSSYLLWGQNIKTKHVCKFLFKHLHMLNTFNIWKFKTVFEFSCCHCHCYSLTFPSFNFSILLKKSEVLPFLSLWNSHPFLHSRVFCDIEKEGREMQKKTFFRFWKPSPPLQRIWEPRKTAVLFLWRFVFHLIRLRSVRVSKRCLRSKTKVKPCFYVSFIFFPWDLFSFILWSTNSAVNYGRLGLVVRCARVYRIKQGMVRVFLVTFYLHKFIASTFCA